MKGVVLENLIYEKLDSMATAIAFCCEKKYEKVIKDRLKDVLIYVYEDDFQIERMEDIDLLEIAMDFARDISDSLDVNEKRRNEINLTIANMFVALKDKEFNYDAQKFIADQIKSIPELKKEYKRHVDTVSFLLEHYKNDYEVKKIEESIASYDDRRRYFNDGIREIKRDLLSEFLGITCGITRVDGIWEDMTAFKSDFKDMLWMGPYKDELMAMQARVLLMRGAKGDSYADVIADGYRRDLVPNSAHIEGMETLFVSKYNLLVKEYMFRNSNIDRILMDLKEKKDKFQEEYLRFFLFMSASLEGLEVSGFDSRGICVIFPNTRNLYTDSFINTSLHELIHYMGGVNPRLDKERLVYKNDPRYIALDESWTNYLAGLAQVEYCKFDVNIVDYNKTSLDACRYDCTLAYMEQVFKLYGKKLIEIHLSETIDLERAKRMCPFEQMADSVYRIYCAKDADVKKVIKQEITKLSRGDLR